MPSLTRAQQLTLARLKVAAAQQIADYYIATGDDDPLSGKNYDEQVAWLEGLMAGAATPVGRKTMTMMFIYVLLVCAVLGGFGVLAYYGSGS